MDNLNYPQVAGILWESGYNFMGIEWAGDIPILLKILHFSVFKDALMFLVWYIRVVLVLCTTYLQDHTARPQDAQSWCYELGNYKGRRPYETQ